VLVFLVAFVVTFYLIANGNVKGNILRKAIGAAMLAIVGFYVFLILGLFWFLGLATYLGNVR
jgi:hypothetical protein